MDGSIPYFHCRQTLGQFETMKFEHLRSGDHDAKFSNGGQILDPNFGPSICLLVPLDPATEFGVIGS